MPQGGGQQMLPIAGQVGQYIAYNNVPFTGQGGQYNAYHNPLSNTSHGSNMPVLTGPSQPIAVTQPNTSSQWMGPPAQTVAWTNTPTQIPQGHQMNVAGSGPAMFSQPQGQQVYDTGPQYQPSYYNPAAASFQTDHILMGNERISRKSARATMDRLRVSLKALVGDETVYVGACTGVDYKLSHHNDAVFFVDALARKLEMADGRVWGFPTDQLCTDGIFRPVPDQGTPFRVELFSQLIPSSSATRTMMTPNTLVTTYLINGSRCQVPYEQVTITDWARILVAEAAAVPSTKAAAKNAIDSVQLEPGEAWTSASARMLLHMQALGASQDRPFESEAKFFWRFVAAGTTVDILDRTLRLFLPQPSDYGGMESYLVQVTRKIKDTCIAMQVDYNNPSSEAMKRRGTLLSKIHTEFISDLSNRSNRFFSAEELGSKQRQVNGKRAALSVGALSHRRPIGGGNGERTPFTRQSTRFTRRSLLGALTGDPLHSEHADLFSQITACLESDTSDSDVVELPNQKAQVAAFDNRAASKPGATGTPYQPRTLRRSAAESAEQNPRAHKIRRTGTSEAFSEEEELPEPGDNEDLVFEALRRKNVCFFHARGLRCPYNGGGKRCRFSHDNKVVPAGMYARKKALTQEEEAKGAMLAAYGGDIDGLSVATSATEEDSDNNA